MKITVVTESCDLSETAEYRELARRGHRIHVLHDPSRDCATAFAGTGVTTGHLAVRHRLDLGAARKLRRTLVADIPELVYAPVNKTLAISLMATRGIAVKVVGYRGTMGHLSHWDPASLITYFHPRLAGIVCLSQAVERYLISMRTTATTLTAYKAFDVQWYTAGEPADPGEFDFPPDSFIVGFTGNVRPVKGVDILLKALAQLPDTSRIQLLLVGEVRCKKVQRMLRTPAYSARVHLTGYRGDACQLTGACDVFVMPSIEREGLCRAVVEAMSQSVPAVVSDVGGMPELVEDGVSGLVVAPSDPTALANALLALEQDRSRLAMMGQAACDRIRTHFTIARATDRMEELFNTVVN